MGKDHAGHGFITVTLTAEGVEAIADAVIRKLREQGLVTIGGEGVPSQASDGKRVKTPVAKKVRTDSVDSMNTATLPETGFLRLPEILKVIPVGRTTWWEGCKAGKFLKGIKLSARITVWRADDIRTFIEQTRATSSGSWQPPA